MTYSCRLCVFGFLCGFNFLPLRHKGAFSKALIQPEIPWATRDRQDFQQHAPQLDCEQSGDLGILRGSIPDWG
jgi:hypothetical protein